MLVGLKVEPDFDTRAAYRRLLGGEHDPSRLVEIGIEAVEIPVRPGGDLDAVAAAALRCTEAGLRVSFHPYTEGMDVNPVEFTDPASAAATAHRSFFAMAERFAAAQGETIVNIHPAAARDTRSRTGLVERSVAFFSWAQAWCSAHTPGVVPVAELQVAPLEGETIVRAGDTPGELEEIVTRSGVPACWDLGHAVWNHRRFGTRLEPTDGLWERIGHVHCHDVDAVDHRVLRRGDAPWRDFLERLSARGFSGTVVIEVAAGTFLEAGGLKALRVSVSAVAHALGRRAAPD